VRGLTIGGFRLELRRGPAYALLPNKGARSLRSVLPARPCPVARTQWQRAMPANSVRTRSVLHVVVDENVMLMTAISFARKYKVVKSVGNEYIKFGKNLQKF